jgi:hypothetical protein
VSGYADFFSSATADEQAMLEMHGLRSVTEGGGLFCGVTEEAFAINGVRYKWPATMKTLRWGLNFARLGQLSDLDFKDAATRWFQEISACCDLAFEYVADFDKANIQYTVDDLDGPRGVLADMQLPVGNLNPTSKVRGRFDRNENWVLSDNPREGEIDGYRTGAHETGHGVGMGHQATNVAPDKKALLAPIYSLSIKNFQIADRLELQIRYGNATVQPPPPPSGKPITLDSVHTLRQGDRTWTEKTSAILKPV